MLVYKIKSLLIIPLGLILSQCGELRQVFTPQPTTSLHSSNPSRVRSSPVSVANSSAPRAPIITKQGTYYFVQENDTLSEISNRFRMDDEEIAQINDLFETQLVVGRRLFIPNKRTKSQYIAVTKAILETKIQVTQKKDMTFAWPVAGVVSSSFGWRHGRNHDGLDISAKTGTPIYATEDGRVLFAKRFAGYGNLVVIKHAQDYFSAYAHAQNIMVDIGSKVKKGDQIATVGNTGRSTGPHLHFEIRKNIEALDPRSLLPPSLPDPQK